MATSFFYVYMGWAYAIRPYEFCEYYVECNTNNNPVLGLDGYRAKPRCRSIGIMILVHPLILVWRAVPCAKPKGSRAKSWFKGNILCLFSYFPKLPKNT